MGHQPGLLQTSEKLFNEVSARVEEQTQLTQQFPDGLSVKLSTEKVNKVFQEVKILKYVYILVIIS